MNKEIQQKLKNQNIHNLKLIDYKINKDIFQFKVRINDLFTIIINVNLIKKRFGKKDIIKVMDSILFDLKNFKKALDVNNKYFEFNIDKIQDINYTIFADYYKMFDVFKIHQYIEKEFSNNIDFNVLIKNFYLLSILTKIDKGMLKITTTEL